MKRRDPTVRLEMDRDPAFVRCERLLAGHRSRLPDPRRADPGRLDREIRVVSQSPIVTAVLEAADAVLLVLNAERQIVAFNSRIATIAQPGDVLGRRAGEALACVNARGPGGCGAAPGCATCGSLGAILGCRRGRPVESECLVKSEHHGGTSLELNVRASQVAVEDETFTVVSLRDISAQKRREVLEQVFFHDVMNTVSGLRGWALLLQRPGADTRRAGERIDLLSRQLEREIRDQRALLHAEHGTLVPEPVRVRPDELLGNVADLFAGHPVSRERRLEIAVEGPELELTTDPTLLVRVLANMVRNALEATPAGGRVRAWWEAAREGAVRFAVHNAGAIAPDVQARIFHRSFSTKGERGRGLGTYSMKLFGEKVLGGAVSFASTEHAGTVFSVTLPATSFDRLRTGSDERG
jgi:signal transduction histidine kinase